VPPPRTRLLPTLLALVCFSPIEAFAQTLAAKEAPHPLPTEVRWSVAVSVRPAATPTIGGDRILLALESGVVVAYRQSDGVEAWRVEMHADWPIATGSDRVFVASGEAIHALALENAQVLWRAPAGTLTAPLLAQDGWIIAASVAGLAAFRASDGMKVWQRETGLQRGRATIEGDNLYVPLEDGRLLALDLQTGTDRWVRRFSIPKPAESGPRAPGVSEVLAFPDRLFVGAADGIFYCLKASDGSVDWRFRIGAVLRGRPVSDGTRIYISAMDNVVRAFDRRTGALLWHPSVPFRPTTSPVLLGATLLVPGAASEVRGFDTAGKPAGQIKLEDALAIPPVFDETPGGAVMAAVTGSLNGQWKLLLVEQSRALPVVPLTVLPGITVPVAPPGPIG
jgi:putative pyrroloquinoline-quinone binding quinoprotein/putative pyrroloquinoline-quinone-binding quinoprotein